MDRAWAMVLHCSLDPAFESNGVSADFVVGTVVVVDAWCHLRRDAMHGSVSHSLGALDERT